MAPRTSHYRIASFSLLFSLLSCLVYPAAVVAQAPVDTAGWHSLEWRMLGPAHTGRMTSVAGSSQRPDEYYVGTTGGGVWKTTDGGKTWHPMTDGYFGGTIGSVDVFKGDPDIVWAGGGETPIRGNVSHGDGVWKSTDAGKTWHYMGLRETEYISRVVTHPTNPDIAYVGALGHVFGPNAERGVYRTKDGGKTWDKILFKNDSTGVADLVMDPSDPNTLYAGFWQAGRTPWLLVSGGAGSGLWKTTDGGDHWTDITRSPGLPSGIWGNIGLAISPANPNRIWALIEADSGGVYRSDDGGATWHFLNGERNLRQRAWYFTKLTADPKDTNTIYAGNVGGYVSHDGGKTFQSGLGNGDTHFYWIDPQNPQRIAVAGDPGLVITTDGGKTTTRVNIPTGQYYHVHLTAAEPYDVCGAEQDGGVDCFPIREANGGRGGFGGGRGGRGGGSAAPASQWNFTTRYGGAGGESGYVASDPLDPDVTFGGNYSGVLETENHRTGQSERLDPWPLNPMGHDASDSKYRFQWTYPIVNSPNNPKALYVGSNVLFKSNDLGQSWKIVSPDLTRHDPATLGASGGPLTKDQTSVEYYGTIFTVAESPVAPGLVWTGSDDGLIYVTRNVNALKPVWTNVTPKDLPKWTRISIVEPSPHHPGTMYFAANRYEMDDFRPLLYKTTDYGVTWKKIVDGIPPTEFTRAIREDLVRPGMLYAATERGMYISYDAGDHWQSLRRNLPPVAVHDIALRDDDIVIATMGRGFYAMEGIAALRDADHLDRSAVHLYQPAPAYRNTGAAKIEYTLPEPGPVVTLELLDSHGTVLQKVSSADTVPTGGRGGGRGGFRGRGGGGAGGAPVRVGNAAGLNSYELSLRYPEGTNFRGAVYWDGNGLNGPVAAPGTYTVKLTVADQAPQTRPLVVRKNPETTASNADIAEQVNFLLRIRDTVSAANNAVRTIRNVRYQLDSLRPRVTGAAASDFASRAKTLDDSMTLVEEALYQTKLRASEDPLNYPIRLNNQIGALSGFVASGERRPPQQAYDVWNTLVPQLNLQLLRLKRILATELPPVNAALTAAGQPEIVPSSDELGAPPAGRGGRGG
ncbi:MAG: WD40/YVTN/BNR-like repeat-containing protein [Gemmatimonadales bacterium]